MRVLDDDEAIAETSSDWAPSYVMPADRKWVRDAVIAELLVSTLRGTDLQRPAAPDDLDGLVIP